MLSNLELRHIVESAFLPMKCTCTITPVNSMTVQIIDEATGAEEFTVTGIDSSALVSSRAIAALVLELKEEFRLRHLPAGSKVRNRQA